QYGRVAARRVADEDLDARGQLVDTLAQHLQERTDAGCLFTDAAVVPGAVGIAAQNAAVSQRLGRLYEVESARTPATAETREDGNEHRRIEACLDDQAIAAVVAARLHGITFMEPPVRGVIFYLPQASLAA